MQSKEGINEVLIRIDAFIRKYYLNRLLRGGILTFAIVLASFLLINVIVYYISLPVWSKKLLFYGWLASTALFVYAGILSPLMGYFSLGKRISKEQAASIIGTHFVEIKDKLLNLLQLHDIQIGSKDSSLLKASIDQKINEVSWVSFPAAIDLSINKKYLRYLLPPLLLLLFIVIAAPNMIPEATYRMTSDQFQASKAPFDWLIQNEDLSVMQFEDFRLNLRLEGRSIPASVSVKLQDGAVYKMDKVDDRTYTYDFKKVRQSTVFNFEASGYRSDDFELKVIPKPLVMDFSIDAKYPAYTGKPNETFENVGDVTVPEGTELIWTFKASNTNELILMFPDSNESAIRVSEQNFQFRKRAMADANYMVQVRNKEGAIGDSLLFYMQVVKDQYPSIQVAEYQDSMDEDYHYYLGEITDDYGFKNLTFNYQIRQAEKLGKLSPMKSIPINFNRDRKIQAFNHYWNIKDLGLMPGDEIVYYFEVFDNDGIRGSKSTRSRQFTQQMKTMSEMEEKTEKSNDEIKEKLAESIDESKEIQEEVKKLKERLLEKKNLSWDDKKAMQQLLDKQKNLENELSKVEDEYKKNLKDQSEFKKSSEDIMEKQKKVQELFEELMSDEMKEMFRKLEEMMEDMNKDNMLEQLENFEMNDEQLEKELDRMLDLFKQMEMEQKMEDAKSKLEDLAKKQEELSEETKNSDKKNSEDLQKKQDELNKEFEKVKEEMKEIQEMQKELGQEMDFSDMKKSEEAVDQNQEGAQQDLQKGDQKGASEKQKKASDEMQKMAGGMQSMMNSMQQQQMEEDMESLRQILENLVLLSMDQERLMKEIKQTSINTPKYVDLVQQQFKIIDDTKIVEDSLLALAKRVFQIQSFITDELADIERNLKGSVKELEERRVSNANIKQQYTMTGYNNLALMLSEVMEQMQQEMSSSMSGQQMCQKKQKKKGQSQIPSLRQMQQQLNDQMSKMQEMMKDGQKKPGQQGGKGEMTKEMAQMAAKQAAIRQALNELNQQMNKDGKKGLGDLEKLMDQMDKTEEDLVNKRLTNEMLERQKEIMTRLLEAEKAEKEREFEEKRESKSANEMERKVPPSLEEYLKKRSSELELFKTVPPGLKPYYKNLVEQYFKDIAF